MHGKSPRDSPWTGGVNWISGSGIGIVTGGEGEGWTLSRATHTLASGLYVALHLPEIPSGEAWCDSVELNDLSMGLCA